MMHRHGKHENDPHEVWASGLELRVPDSAEMLEGKPIPRVAGG